MTNGDKIRNMTDGQLAEFLADGESKPCVHCPYDDDIGCKGGIICTKEHLQDVFLNWLSSEAVSERSENSCSACEYYDSDLGCTLRGPCPYQ